MEKYLQNKNLWLYGAWIISIVAALSSLALSEIFNLPPCELCWYQRIFMYPIPVILGIGIWRKLDDQLPFLVLPFAIIGGLIAAYHYFLQMFTDPNASACVGGISCTSKQIEVLGFMTIPFGAFWCFVGIAVLMCGLLRFAKAAK